MTNKPNDVRVSRELLPCPFCAQQDAFVEQLDSDASVVICQGRVGEHSACLARGPVGVQESDVEDQPGRNAAVREWNRRAQIVSTIKPPTPTRCKCPVCWPDHPSHANRPR